MWLLGYALILTALQTCNGNKVCPPADPTVTDKSTKLIALFIAQDKLSLARVEFWQLPNPWKNIEEAYKVLLDKDSQFPWISKTPNIEIKSLNFTLGLITGQHERKCDGVGNLLQTVEQHHVNTTLLGIVLELATALERECKVNSVEKFLNNTIKKLVPQIENCDVSDTINLLFHRNSSKQVESFYDQLFTTVLNTDVIYHPCLHNLNYYLPKSGDDREVWMVVATGWQAYLKSLEKAGWNSKTRQASAILARAVRKDLEAKGDVILKQGAANIYAKVKAGIPNDIASLYFGESKCSIQNHETGAYLVAAEKGNQLELHHGSLDTLGFRKYWEMEMFLGGFSVRNWDWKRETQHMCVEEMTHVQLRQGPYQQKSDSEEAKLCYTITRWYILPMENGFFLGAEQGRYFVHASVGNKVPKVTKGLKGNQAKGALWNINCG